MTEQLIAPVRPGTATRELTRDLTRELTPWPCPVARNLPGPHAVDVVDHLVALVEHAPDRRIEGSLVDLARASGCDVDTARRAVTSLDPADHVLSVDVRRIPAEAPWQLTWAPVTGIVDLMLDWDLHTLDIALEELSDWLDVPSGITGRALEWLASTPGVSVVRRGAGSRATVRIAIVLEECPHTAEAPPVAG